MKFGQPKPANLLKVTLLRACLTRFLNCTNGTNSRKASRMILYFFGCIVIRFFRPLATSGSYAL